MRTYPNDTSAASAGTLPAAAARPALKVGYLLHRFPSLTETFIMREMAGVRRLGVDLRIYSLLPPKFKIVHDQARSLLPCTTYSRFLSWAVIGAQLYFLCTAPLRYARAFCRLVWQTYREPKVLLASLALFPKSVFFARRMQQDGIEHIHAHFAWLEALAAGVAADLIGVTFTIHPHAFDLFSRSQRNVRCQLRHASGVVAISEYHRRYIHRLCPGIDPEKISVIHCGVDPDVLRPASQPPTSDTIRILSVGRVMEKKGFEYLVEACKMLSQRGVDYRCEIVGYGPKLTEVLQQDIDQHRLTDRILFLGPRSENEIVDLYRQSHIFALPCVVARNGDRDGIPVVLMEAMACELACVTTAVAGIPDLVQDGETGLIVEQRDALSLADALERLIADPQLRRRLGKSGRRKVEADFHIDETASRVVALFRRCRGGEQPRTPFRGEASEIDAETVVSQ